MHSHIFDRRSCLQGLIDLIDYQSRGYCVLQRGSKYRSYEKEGDRPRQREMTTCPLHLPAVVGCQNVGERSCVEPKEVKGSRTAKRRLNRSTSLGGGRLEDLYLPMRLLI